MVRRIFYGWWIVGACFLLAAYVGGIFYGFTAFFRPIVEEFGWSYTKISVASSLRGLEMGLFAPILGILVDRFGSRKLILLGVIVMGFGFFLFSQTRSLLTFYAAFLLLALGAGGCASVVLMTVIVQWFRLNVGKALGVMACGFGASGLTVPLMVWMIDAMGWRTALVTLGFGIWGLGIPLCFVIRDRPEMYGYHPDGMELSVHDDGFEEPEPEVGFRETLKDRGFWYIIVSESIRMMVLAAVVLHVMPYLSHLGVPRARAGLIAAAIPLLSIIGRLGFGWLGDLMDKRRAMALSAFLMGVGMLAFSGARNPLLIYAFLAVFPAGYGGSMALRGAILREYFGRAAFGKSIGLLMGIASTGGVIGPTLAGLAFDKLGRYQPLWLAFCGMIALAVILLLRIKPLAVRSSNPSGG